MSTTSTYPSPPPVGGGPSTDKPPKFALVTGLVLLLLSLGSCGFGVTKVYSVVTDVRDAIEEAENNPVGSVVSVENAEGLVMIFGNRSDLRCKVQDQDGNEITENVESPVSEAGSSGKGAEFFLQGFEANPSISYELTCTNSAEDGEFVVVNIPDLGTASAGIASVAAAALLFIIGGIMFIVGLVRRGKWKRERRQGGDLSGLGPIGPTGSPAPGSYGSVNATPAPPSPYGAYPQESPPPVSPVPVSPPPPGIQPPPPSPPIPPAQPPPGSQSPPVSGGPEEIPPTQAGPNPFA